MLNSLLQKYKKLLIGAGIIAVAALGYSFFSDDGSSEGLTSQAVGSVPQEGGDLIALLAELKSIDLDTSILQDPVFLTLEDFTVSLSPEPVGRANPFAPLGVGNSPSATTTPSDEE